MKALFNLEDLNLLSATADVLFECECCSSVFKGKVGKVKSYLKQKENNALIRSRFKYCSLACHGKTITLKKVTNCTTCNKEISLYKKEAKKSKSGNHFCCKSCSAIYNNRHRKRESKIKS